MTNGEKQARLRVIDRHKKRLELKLSQLEALDRRFSWIRLAVLLAGGLAASISFFFGPPALGPLVLVIFVVSFAFVVYQHRKLDRSLLRFRIAEKLAISQIARMSLDWELIPATPPHLPDTTHPFENDLNLSGERSLHQLLDTATSDGGSRRLGEWLLKIQPGSAVGESSSDDYSGNLAAGWLSHAPGYPWRINFQRPIQALAGTKTARMVSNAGAGEITSTNAMVP